MKFPIPITIFSCFAVVLAIGTGCKEAPAPKDAPPPGDTSITIERPLGYKVIDSATAAIMRTKYLDRNKNNDMFINDIHTSEFDGVYMIQFGPVQALAEKYDMVLFNGESPEAPFAKAFAIVAVDAEFKPLATDAKNSLMQNNTGLCPTLCDVTNLRPPSERTVSDIAKFVNALYTKTEKTKALNAVQIDKRCMVNFDNETAFLQMVWGMPTDSTYSMQISPCTLDGNVDYTQAIISIPQQHIKRQKL